MKTWNVEIGFSFTIGGPEKEPGDKEIRSVLVKRLTAGGIKPSNYVVVRGQDEDCFFKDRSEG